MGGMCSFCFGDPSPEPQRPTESEIVSLTNIRFSTLLNFSILNHSNELDHLV